MSGPAARGVVAVGVVAALLDSLFVATLAPILPTFQRELHLDSSAVGLLSGSYGLGLLAGSLPAGLVAARSPRGATVASLLLQAVASALFGLAAGYWELVAARTLQGVASAGAWTAALAWLASVTPSHDRGRLLGLVFGAGFAGLTAGPLAGSAAAVIGRRDVFFAFAAFACVAAGAAALARSPERRLPRGRGTFRDLARERAVGGALLLISLPTLALSGTTLVATLRLGDLGAGPLLIAGVFAFASLVRAGVSPLAGRWGDRRGTAVPTLASLSAAAAGTALLAVTDSRLAFAMIATVTLVAGGVLLVPASSLLAAAVEKSGAEQAFGFALLNLVWAPASLAGSLVAGGLRDHIGDSATLLALAVAMPAPLLLRAVYSREPRRRDVQPEECWTDAS